MLDDEADAPGKRPWTLKGVTDETRSMGLMLAAKLGLPMGEVVGLALAGMADRERGNRIIPPGRPDQEVSPRHPVSLTEFAHAATALAALSAAAGVPVQKAVARGANSLMRDWIRGARGLPAPAPRRKPLRIIEG